LNYNLKIKTLIMMKKQETKSKSGATKKATKTSAKVTSNKKVQNKTTASANKTTVTTKKAAATVKNANNQQKKLNELVEKLTKKHDVECARPEKTAEALKECIDRDYVHVMFKKTGTELGIQLDRRFCKFEEADFENAKGKVQLVGGLTLNYDKVKCIAEVDLTTCEGKGYLEPVNDEDYKEMMEQSDK
jgi:hypothetical protein